MRPRHGMLILKWVLNSYDFVDLGHLSLGMDQREYYN